MTKESPEQTARKGVALGTNLVACLTWLETLFEHAPEGPKNARFGIVSHEIWPSKVSGLRDSRMLPPGTPNVQRGISPSGQLRMEQVRSSSASTRRVDVENGLARPIWMPELEVTPKGSSGPFLRLRQKRVVFQEKVCHGRSLNTRWGGLPKTTEGTMRRGGLPPHFHMVPRRAGVALRGEAWDGASLPHLGHCGVLLSIPKHWVGKCPAPN